MSAEREAAIAYARLGLPIFPLHPIIDDRCGCHDSKCKAIGKHPIPTGWQNSIVSVPAAESCWRSGLGARGIGLVCGPKAGIFGVDADRRHGADATLQDWKRRGRRIETVTDASGDGWHFLYRWPKSFEVEIRAQDLGGGLQVRGAAHFLVLAPSLHHSGKRYQWIRSPFDQEVAEAPSWLLELIAAKSHRTPIVADGEQQLVKIGERYHALVRFLGLLRSMGFGEKALVGFTDVFLDTSVEVDDDPDHKIDRDHAHAAARDIARRYLPYRTKQKAPLVVRGAVPAPGGSVSSFPFQSVRAVFPHTAYR